ncbi:MAG: alpha-L-fucosidase [Lentisphaeria bacterium]
MHAFRFGDGRDWFFSKPFGMFVHWGLYAIPAWHEQVQQRRGMQRAAYEELIDSFNPQQFDPDAWLDVAASAGMTSLCFTTKHHDGFCLWDTRQTDFNVMQSPYGKDILGLLAEACQRRGVPLSLYYSIVDWHHPNYPNQGRNHELPGPEPGDTPDLERYLRFLNEQVRELCTNYGEIHGFWWDNNRTDVRDPSINEMIRKLQPNAVINDRGFDDGDFGTPERDYDSYVNEVAAFDRPTQAVESVGHESWGYKADEDYHADSYLIRSIDKILAKGGVYLLNVGPTADGAIPPEAVRILQTIGRWYAAVNVAFDPAVPAPGETENRDVLLTRNGNNLYVHLYKPPPTSRVHLKPIRTLPKQAVLLNTGVPVETCVDFLPSEAVTDSGHHEYLRLRNLPVNDLADTVMVVQLTFD